MSEIINLFSDPIIVKKIQNKLPHLFRIAETEASRGGKIGMEIGSVRERIVISLLRYYFGQDNINDNIPITEPETDVILFNNPISIKTKTGTHFSGIKAIWTVDWKKIDTFVQSYIPKVDILLVKIIWGSDGGFYYIPTMTQNKVFNNLERENYFKIPPRGTNPRGIEYSPEAFKLMLMDNNTCVIPINWKRGTNGEINIYEKWDKHWAED